MYKIYEDMKCPLCGAKIQENDKAFGCTKWRDEDGGCRFTIWKNFRGHAWTKEEVEKLIEGKTVGPMVLKKKNGDDMEASVRYDKDSEKLDLVFPGRKKGSEKKHTWNDTPAVGSSDSGMFDTVDEEDLPF